MSGPSLAVSLSAGYGRQTVLNELAFTLSPGERLGLLGPSGTGKSTLLLAMLGLLPRRGGWTKGEVLIQGRNLLAMSRGEARALRGREIALVPQSPLTALNPVLSLQTHFEQSWKAHKAIGGSEFRTRLGNLLARVGLPDSTEFLKRRPGQISVGQAQRCTLALALLHRPSVVIADEPTSSLDPVTQAEVLNLLRETTEEQGAALLFVSHDLLSVLRLCTAVAVLAEGRIAEQMPVHDIVEAKEASLQRLLRSLPVPADVLIRHMRHDDQRTERVSRPSGSLTLQ